MATEKLILNFPQDVVKKPVVYHIAKDFGLEFNILRAEITPEFEGKMVLEIKGKKEKIESCKEYLQNEGVKVSEASREIILDKNLCVDCGLCVSLCFVKAFYNKEDTYEVDFDKDKCILCGICLNACPVNAIKAKV